MGQIAIVDDHPIVAGAMADLLTSTQQHTVHCVCDSIEAFLTAQAQANSELLLLDIALAERNSLGELAGLLATYPALKVIVFSMFDTRPYMQGARNSGAKGFVSKSRLHIDLPLAVERVLAGGEFFETDMVETNAKTAAAQLSPRERVVLRHTVLGDSPKSIAKKLDCAVKTVHAHLANIATKLDSKDRVFWREIAQTESLISPTELV